MTLKHYWKRWARYRCILISIWIMGKVTDLMYTVNLSDCLFGIFYLEIQVILVTKSAVSIVLQARIENNLIRCHANEKHVYQVLNITIPDIWCQPVWRIKHRRVRERIQIFSVIWTMSYINYYTNSLTRVCVYVCVCVCVCTHTHIYIYTG